LWIAPFDMKTLKAGLPSSLPLDVLFDNLKAHDPVPQLGVSMNGTLVYAAGSGSVERTGRLVWLDREGTMLEDLGPVPAGLPSLQLSPDETQLALEYRDGRDVVVSILDMARGFPDSRLMTKRQIYRGMPVWMTPEADQLILSRPGMAEGARMVQETTGATAIAGEFRVTGSWLFPFSLSDDGARLWFDFASTATVTDIGVYEFGTDAAEGTWEPLVNTVAHEFGPSWSPDGGLGAL